MKKVLVLCLGCFLSVCSYADDRINVGLFSSQDVDGWKQKEFAGHTEYALKSIDNKVFLSAKSDKSASAYYKKIKIDLEKTPYINWSWSVQRSIDPGAETEKSGDDFVARLYVIKDGGLFFWKTLALNYVWSHQHSRNQTWENPFAGKNAMMFSQRDSASPQNTWFSEKRNVKQDFEKLYGKEISKIDGVAIMTDTDNSGQIAEASYGDIYFTAD